MCLGSGWASLDPTELEGEQETVTGEADRGQVTQGLGCHTEDSRFSPEGCGKPWEGSEQGRDMTRLVCQEDPSACSVT